jgi:hypothetical protein
LLPGPLTHEELAAHRRRRVASPRISRAQAAGKGRALRPREGPTARSRDRPAELPRAKVRIPGLVGATGRLRPR